ncbi:hypothetical protein [Neptuniibacter sp. QD37_11]|uniref:hypothetical protein n=1 Tax=Neptuniibacter sp. QD37_11 TaxID=3398209 RepID=UPI0039F57717
MIKPTIESENYREFIISLDEQLKSSLPIVTTPNRRARMAQIRIRMYLEDGRFGLESGFYEEDQMRHLERNIKARFDDENCRVMKALLPELAHVVEWCGRSIEGPANLVANTLYHASSEPAQLCHHLYLSQESDSIMTSDSHLAAAAANEGDTSDKGLQDLNALAERLQAAGFKTYTKVSVLREKKVPDLEAARSTAQWPDATLEQLQDETAVRGHLNTIIDQFKADMASIGFSA